MTEAKELVTGEDGKHIQAPFQLLEPNLLHFSERKDPVYHEVFKLPAFQRLQGVKALGFLARITNDWYSGVKRTPDKEGRFPHSRMYHSILVARTTEAILRRNNFSEEEINLGILAGLLHDIATPAGGDAIKGLDPVRLDEEDHWQDVLEEQGREIIRKAGITTRNLDQTIHNEGIVGQVLDVADRIAYTFADTYYMDGFDLGKVAQFPYKEIQVDIKNQIVVFTDPYGLGEILFARALNFYKTYMAPENRAADLLIRRIVEPFYGLDGSRPLDPTKLRQMTDVELFAFLQCEYDVPLLDSLDQAFVDFSPEFYDSSPGEETDDLVAQIKKSPDMLIIGEEWLPKVNSCTSYLIRHPTTGKIMPFKEYNPWQAGAIETVTEKRSPYFLYAYDASKPTAFNELARRILK